MSRLQGYWPLDESSGDAIDYSGNGFSGTVNGATQGATGILNTPAYDFDGTSSHVALPSTGVGTGSVSISAWVYFDTTDADDTIVGAFDSGSNDIFTLKNNESNGQWQFALGVFNGNMVTAETTAGEDGPNAGQWYHVVGVADKTAGEVRIYVDGIEVASASGTIGDFDNADDFYIGARNNTGSDDRHLDGRIEEVRIYSRPITDLEVKSLYDAAATAYLKTDWQTFSGGSLDPTSTFFNIDVSLNNQSVKAFIVSDINGDDEIDEVSDPIDITSNTQNVQPTSLPTLNDKFALLFEINTTNVEEGAVLNSASFSTTQEDSGGEEPTTPTYTATDPVGTIQVGEKQVPLTGAVQPVTALDAGIIQRNTFAAGVLEATTTVGNYIPFREASLADTGVRAENIIQETAQPSVGPVGEVNALIPIIIPTTGTDPIGEIEEFQRQEIILVQAPLATSSEGGNIIEESVSDGDEITATTGEGPSIVKDIAEESSVSVTTVDADSIDKVITGPEFVAVVDELPSVPVGIFIEAPIEGFIPGLTAPELIRTFTQAVEEVEFAAYRVVDVTGATSPVGALPENYTTTNETYNTGSPGVAEVKFRVGVEPLDVTDTAAILNADVDDLNATQEPFIADIQNIDITEAFIVVDIFTTALPTITLVDAGYLNTTYTAPIQNFTLVDGQYITPTYEEALAAVEFTDSQFLPQTIFTQGAIDAGITGGVITQATIRELNSIEGILTDGQLDRVTLYVGTSPVGRVYVIGSLTFGAGKGVILRTNVEGIILTDGEYNRSTVS